jgi:hypothetical protein
MDLRKVRPSKGRTEFSFPDGDVGNGVKQYNQDTGDLMPARRKTCLKPTSAVKAQAFAPLSRGEKKVVPYDGIAIIYNRNVDDNLK